MDNKILISGTGRCGTGAISKVLSDCDILCGHERVYSITGVKQWGEMYKAESSWLAAPYFPKFKGTRILLIRSPRSCITSLVSMKLFHEPRHIYSRYLGGMGYGLGIEEAIRFYMDVNSVLYANCDYVLNVDYLFEVLPEEIVKKWENYNKRKKDRISFPGKEFDEAIDLYENIHGNRLKKDLLEHLNVSN